MAIWGEQFLPTIGVFVFGCFFYQVYSLVSARNAEEEEKEEAAMKKAAKKAKRAESGKRK